jgi:hypothetical protein
VAASIEQLSFELTSNALAEQERALSDLRARAGTVLAAASIAGSFFGAKTIHSSLGVRGALAMVAFALCFASSIWVLLPHSFVFALRGEAMLAVSDHRGVTDVDEAYRAAGIWVEPHLDANGDKLAELSTWVAMGCALLGAEVILWTLSLID